MRSGKVRRKSLRKFKKMTKKMTKRMQKRMQKKILKKTKRTKRTKQKRNRKKRTKGAKRMKRTRNRMRGGTLTPAPPARLYERTDRGLKPTSIPAEVSVPAESPEKGTSHLPSRSGGETGDETTISPETNALGGPRGGEKERYKALWAEKLNWAKNEAPPQPEPEWLSGYTEVEKQGLRAWILQNEELLTDL